MFVGSLLVREREGGIREIEDHRERGERGERKKKERGRGERRRLLATTFNNIL